jgi:hypothetical protein
MPTDSTSLVPRRGRPRKFTVPSRPITLTLPDHVIDALSAIDHDVSRAVVRLMQPRLARRAHPPAELATFGRRAVIVVNPSRTLEQRTGISLIHLPDGRALISFDQPQTIAGLELLISDALDERRLSREDEAIFQAIADILRSARRSDDLIVLQRNVIVLETRRGRPAQAASAPRGRSRPRAKGGKT